MLKSSRKQKQRAKYNSMPWTCFQAWMLRTKRYWRPYSKPKESPSSKVVSNLPKTSSQLSPKISTYPKKSARQASSKALTLASKTSWATGKLSYSPQQNNNSSKASSNTAFNTGPSAPPSFVSLRQGSSKLKAPIRMESQSAPGKRRRPSLTRQGKLLRRPSKSRKKES